MERCWSKEATARPTFLEICTQLKLLSCKLFDGSVTNSRQQNSSNPSWRSSNSHDINGGGYTRNYLSSYSHNYWLHAPHLSSNQSLNSSHHPALSLRSRDDLLPPSDAFFRLQWITTFLRQKESSLFTERYQIHAVTWRLLQPYATS